MLIGGVTTTTLTIIDYIDLPLQLDANLFGISASLIVFVGLSFIFPSKKFKETQNENS